MSSKVFCVVTALTLAGFVPPLMSQTEETSQPVTLAAQWQSHVLQCRAKNIGGWSCVLFPDGTYIYGLVWESTAKRGEPTLWTLVAGPCETCAGMTLLRTYQQAPGPVIKTADLSRAVWIPPGWFVWIAARSEVAAPSLEVHLTLWTSAPGVVIKP